MEGHKYIILHFSRKVGHTKTRISHPEKTVRGNLVLTVTSEFIDRFNVPVFVNELLPVTKVRTYSRKLKSGNTIKQSEHYKYLRTRRPDKIVEIRKKKKGSILLNGNFLFERNYLGFPRFFNYWMIDNALSQILSNAPDFERLRFCINGGETNEILGAETGYGTVSISRTLIDGEAPHHQQWGSVVFLGITRAQ